MQVKKKCSSPKRLDKGRRQVWKFLNSKWASTLFTYRHFQESRDLSPATTKENLWKGLKYRGRIRHSSWRKSKRFTFSRVMPPIDTRHFRVNRGARIKSYVLCLFSSKSEQIDADAYWTRPQNCSIARNNENALHRRRAPSSMFLLSLRVN